MQKRNSLLRIVLFGLSDGVAGALVRGLSCQTQAVYSFPCFAASQCLTLIEDLCADLVFCTAEPRWYKPLLEAVKLKEPNLPIILVSRYPEASEWLEALEAGASDYCAPPFESIQIQWALEAAFKSRCLAA